MKSPAGAIQATVQWTVHHLGTLIWLAACLVTTWWVCSAHRTVGYLCDFSQHWTIGRMVVTGRGHHLYDDQYQWDTLRGDYGQGRLNAKGQYDYAYIGGKGYSDDEIWNHVYTEDIGAVLYPPVAGIIYAPLGLIARPKWAQWALVELSVAAVILTAWLIARLTAGRVSMALLVLLTLLFPDFFFTMGVGQNAFLTLALMTLGWYGMARGRPLAGGLAWGLLVYKPTWLVALGWIPLLLRQWRACAGMALSAGILCLATLPICGIQSWRDWQRLTRKAAAWYEVDTKQIDLSRDLMGIPRRIHVGHPVPAEDPRIGPLFGHRWRVPIGRFFGLPPSVDERMKTLIPQARTATRIGYAILAAVGLITVLVDLRHGRSGVPHEGRSGIGGDSVPATGPRAALLLLAGVMTCVHFMYYDASLVLLPLYLALGAWASLTRWSRGVLLTLGSGLWILMLLNDWVTDLRGIPYSIFLTLGLWVWAIAEVMSRNARGAWIAEGPAAGAVGRSQSV